MFLNIGNFSKTGESRRKSKVLENVKTKYYFKEIFLHLKKKKKTCNFIAIYIVNSHIQIYIGFTRTSPTESALLSNKLNHFISKKITKL